MSVHRIAFASCASALACSCAASAGFHGLVADAYAVVEDGQTYCIVDLYVDLDPGNVLLSVFGANIWLSGAPAWFHSDAASDGPLGGTWAPIGSGSHPKSDSFVTIGGAPAPYPQNATLLAPGFEDGSGPSLGSSAGWFNSNPPELQGMASDLLMHDGSLLGSAVMIGRFSVVGTSDLPRSVMVDAAWFQWSSTPFGVPENSGTFGGSFQYVPGPGAFAALAGVLFATRGRRRPGQGT